MTLGAPPDKPAPAFSKWRDWLDLMVVDHGFLRVLHQNMHAIRPGLYRSAQPSPFDLARFARQGGRHVLNLRGQSDTGAMRLEAAAAAKYGLNYSVFRLYSRQLPSREALLQLGHLLQTLEYPVLAHCKSGADRAGFFAALALLFAGETCARAQQELTLWRGHLKSGPTGILDAFIAAYAQEGEVQGVCFADWLRTMYDPVRIQAGFRPRWWGRVITDTLLKRE